MIAITLSAPVQRLLDRALTQWAETNALWARTLDLLEAPPPPDTPPAQEPAPAPEQPAPPVLFESKDWRVDFPRVWHETVSPDSSRASVTPLSADALEFRITASLDNQAGARALYDPSLTRSWTAFTPYWDKTVEFINTWLFPAEIERWHGEDDGFMQWGWQLKGGASEGANASMAMVLYNVRGVGMRPYLTGNTWEGRAQADDFPLLPVGVPFETRLLVHFHDDPAEGWMELHYAGRSLKVTGMNMSADRKCGCYMNLYGTANGVLIARKTRIAVAPAPPGAFVGMHPERATTDPNTPRG